MVEQEYKGHGYFYRNVRLSETLAPEVEALDRMRFPIFKAVHMFDKAHAIMLCEEGFISRSDLVAMMKAFKKMEREGVDKVRQNVGGGMHSGEAFLIGELGEEVGGKLHLGRSSGDLSSAFFRVLQRENLLAIMHSVNDFRATLLRLAERHLRTVMPGYSQVQHTSPITLGHYFMSWVCALERDFQRFLDCYEKTNSSPAGTGGISGSEFMLNRKRTAELLGFDSILQNSRDATWNADYKLEAFADLATLNNSLGRLAMDLMLWSTSEFGMVELADRYSSTSSINPQKKNAHALQSICGLSGVTLGRMTGAFAIEKTMSDAPIIDRYYYFADFLKTCEDTLNGLKIMIGVVSSMKVNARLMKERAGAFWGQGADVAGLLVKKTGLSWRTAHLITARLIKAAIEGGIPPSGVTVGMLDRAARDRIGRALRINQHDLDEALDPANNVESHALLGGPAAREVRRQVSVSKKILATDNRTLTKMEQRLASAERRLESGSSLAAAGRSARSR